MAALVEPLAGGGRKFISLPEKGEELNSDIENQLGLCMPGLVGYLVSSSEVYKAAPKNHTGALFAGTPQYAVACRLKLLIASQSTNIP